MKVVYAERARQDIADIYDDIALHNPAAAQRVEDHIHGVCDALADFPYASAATDEPDVRRVPLVRFPYTIFYRVNAAQDLLQTRASFTRRASETSARCPMMSRVKEGDDRRYRYGS